MIPDRLAEGVPILLFSDNGHGLGHLTRLLAITRRLPEAARPYFLTLSESHRTVSDHGYPVEYFPSRHRLEIGKRLWNELLSERLLTLTDRLEPAAMVVDHVGPPEALEAVRQARPGMKLVWIRRGLWRAGRQGHAFMMTEAFDRVIEPMDLAAPIDSGLTTRYRARVEYVPPITLLDNDELLPRSEASHALGLDPDHPSVLLHLNADNEDKLNQMILDVARQVRDRDCNVFAPQHTLRLTKSIAADNLVMKPVYPLGQYLNAFDAAVAVSGYNSFHELIAAKVPTVFMPRPTGSLDDQSRRAQFAAMVGAGWFAEHVNDPSFTRLLWECLEPDQQARAKDAMTVIYPGNGAIEAAQIVWELATGHAVNDPAPSLPRLASLENRA